MPLDTAGAPAASLNELLERLTTADQAIEAARGAIKEVAGSWGDRFASIEIDDQSFEGALDEPLASTREAAEAGAQALQTALGEAVRAFAGALENHVQESGSAAEAWSGRAETAHEAQTELHGRLNECVGSCREQFEALQGTHTDARSALEQQFGSLSEATVSLAEALTGALQQVTELGSSFVDRLSGPESDKLNQGLERSGEQTGSVIEQLSNAASDLTTDFRGEVEDELKTFAGHVRDDAREEVERAARELAEQAIEELFKTAAQAVLTSTVGVQITGTMAPVLPQLIAAKRATDVILGGIQVYKKTVGQLAELAEAF